MSAALRQLGLWWLDRRIRLGLDGLSASGLDRLSALAAAGPIVVACTHQSWWDGPIAVWICDRLGLRPTIPMHAHNLARYPFFAAYGAVGVSGPSGVRAALAAMRAPGDVLWIFPQGRHQAPDEPVAVERGALWLARKAGCPLLPVALDYRFGDRPEVQARLCVGAPVEPSESALVDGWAAARASSQPLAALVPTRPEQAGLASRALVCLWRSAWTR